MKAEHFERYFSFSYCTHRTVYRVLWPTDWVVDCIYIDYFRLSTTGTMSLTTQILRTATKWRATPQIINTNMQDLTRILPYLVPLNHN